jgi:uridine kinase
MKPNALVGIAGGSCSGKGYLCRQLLKVLHPMPCLVLPMDAYYRDLSHLNQEERAVRNFDAPDSMDHDLLITHLDALIAGRPINLPIYDFTTHTRTPASKSIQTIGGIILLEGIFALYWEEIRQRLEAKVFISLDSDTCLSRRIKRDVRERGRTPENVKSQFFKTVLPMYNCHVAPTRQYADLVLEGDAPVAVSANRVADFIKSR